MTITLHDSVRAARGDGPDPRIAAILTRIAADVTAAQALVRISCPAGLAVDAITDSRLYVIAKLVAEVLNQPTYEAPEPDGDTPVPTLLYVTADDFAAAKAAEFARGWDAGHTAAGGDGDLEVETP